MYGENARFYPPLLLGRRGVHCWVSDPIARTLPNDARAAVIDYLTVTTQNNNSDKRAKQVLLAPRHPLVERAYKILEPLFERYVVLETGQGLLCERDQYVT
ncbi:hypothetical protein EON63_11005, partial [archaeon]